MNGYEVRLILFKLGNEVYGNKLNNVREAAPLKKNTKVLDPKPYVEGATDLEGMISTLINPAQPPGTPSIGVGKVIVHIINGDKEIEQIANHIVEIGRMGPSEIVTPPTGNVFDLIKSFTGIECSLTPLPKINNILNTIDLS